MVAPTAITAIAVLFSLAGAEGLSRLRCPKFAHPPFRSANFDRGTRFCLAQSAFRGARQRAPRHAVLESVLHCAKIPYFNVFFDTATTFDPAPDHETDGKRRGWVV